MNPYARTLEEHSTATPFRDWVGGPYSLAFSTELKKPIQLRLRNSSKINPRTYVITLDPGKYVGLDMSCAEGNRLRQLELSYNDVAALLKLVGRKKPSAANFWRHAIGLSPSLQLIVAAYIRLAMLYAGKAAHKSRFNLRRISCTAEDFLQIAFLGICQAARNIKPTVGAGNTARFFADYVAGVLFRTINPKKKGQLPSEGVEVESMNTDCETGEEFVYEKPWGGYDIKSIFESSLSENHSERILDQWADQGAPDVHDESAAREIRDLICTQPRDREMLDLRADGFSHRQIAKQVGFPKTNVGERLRELDSLIADGLGIRRTEGKRAKIPRKPLPNAKDWVPVGENKIYVQPQTEPLNEVRPVAKKCIWRYWGWDYVSGRAKTLQSNRRFIRLYTDDAIGRLSSRADRGPGRQTSNNPDSFTVVPNSVFLLSHNSTRYNCDFIRYDARQAAWDHVYLKASLDPDGREENLPKEAPPGELTKQEIAYRELVESDHTWDQCRRILGKSESKLTAIAASLSLKTRGKMGNGLSLDWYPPYYGPELWIGSFKTLSSQPPIFHSQFCNNPVSPAMYAALIQCDGLVIAGRAATATGRPATALAPRPQPAESCVVDERGKNWRTTPEGIAAHAGQPLPANCGNVSPYRPVLEAYRDLARYCGIEGDKMRWEKIDEAAENNIESAEPTIFQLPQPQQAAVHLQLARRRPKRKAQSGEETTDEIRVQIREHQSYTRLLKSCNYDPVIFQAALATAQTGSTQTKVKRAGKRAKAA